MKNRKKFLNVIFIFVSIFTLQSCNVSYYQIRNELKDNLSTESINVCNVNFSVDVHTGIPEYTKEQLRKDQGAYIKATKEVFYEKGKQAWNEKGCLANYVENESNSNFKISIFEQRAGMLPQEWLTLLSVGLIPSWGTHPEIRSYTFENTQNKKRNEYVVDIVFFNHLILVPIFILGGAHNTSEPIEKIYYKKPLGDFIEHY